MSQTQKAGVRIDTTRVASEKTADRIVPYLRATGTLEPP